MKGLKRGFTLIELLIVLVIITSIMGLLFPLGNHLNKKSLQLSVQADVVRYQNAFLDYFEAFEIASQIFVGDVGSSGVKRIGGNNQALLYKYEIKIKGYPDRLFSSKNDYRFDVYSEKGLH